MTIHFSKYHGAGNDFIIIDNREMSVSLSQESIALACDRRFGIGADGLMMIEQEDGYDFRMIYYNSDGAEGTMCGNGGRCIVRFAFDLGLIKSEAHFLAVDGPHKATISSSDTVALHMNEVHDVARLEEDLILNTGSPHFIRWVNSVNDVDVVAEGRAIRNWERFGSRGINVNFVERMGDELLIRTYERGVEDETLACGTGVTAAAIASTDGKTGFFEIKVTALGGELSVTFDKISDHAATNVVLTGPVAFVFSGDWSPNG